MPNIFLILCFAIWFGAATNITSDHVNLKPQPSQAGRSTRNSHNMRSVVYINKKFGFRFLLPESWRGYSIVAGEWEGGDGRTYQPGEAMPPAQKGPLILIGHPLSTEADPRQNIPIMIFTRTQWHLIEDDKLIVSAAPIGPSEIGRNAKYVFALPPRYDYALPTGWEEVAEIIRHHPLRPLTPE